MSTAPGPQQRQFFSLTTFSALLCRTAFLTFNQRRPHMKNSFLSRHDNIALRATKKSYLITALLRHR
jgi:hypothetical protein